MKESLNGHGKRALPDGFISAFISHTDNLESAPIYRQWTAISLVSAVLEQKVYLQTSSPLYPHMYIFLVGPAGIGKTKSIFAGAAFLREIPEFHLSPTSMSAASLVDALVEAKRSIIRLPSEPLEYNSMMICNDELSAFMSKYDDEMMGNLTTFYDVVPYGQRRRGNDLKVKIKSPQLSILTGSTESNLIQFMPDHAWDQGFTSRIIMIWSNNKVLTEDLFANSSRKLPEDMLHDLKIINGLSGTFEVTSDFKSAVNAWRHVGQQPLPNHPKLTNYCNRRLAHLLKLSMVACVDRSNTLLLTKDDFNRAMEWLLVAEQFMPKIFEVGGNSPDARAMDEILHYCILLDKGHGAPEPSLVRRARELVPAMTVLKLFEIMSASGMIKRSGSVQGVMHWKATGH